MGRGTHLCFPDAGMLHKFHVALAYLRNSAATRALWQNQRCHKILPSGLKLHQKNDDMEARLSNIKQHQCQRRFLFSFPKKRKAMRPLEAHPSAGAGASSIGDGRRRVNLVLNIASRPWRRRVNLVPRTLTTLTAPNKLLPSGLKLHQKNDGMEARCCHNSSGLQSLLERQGDRAGGRGAAWSCTPARAPKVCRLHLTRYGPTIICSSSTRKASPGEAPPQVSAP